MSNEFVNLNEIFLPTTGGDIEGSLDVNGALTVNDGSGEGTSYNVAEKISELESAWDSVSHDYIVGKNVSYSWNSWSWLKFNSGLALLFYSGNKAVEAESVVEHTLTLPFAITSGDISQAFVNMIAGETGLSDTDILDDYVTARVIVNNTSAIVRVKNKRTWTVSGAFSIMIIGCWK